MARPVKAPFGKKDIPKQLRLAHGIKSTTEMDSILGVPYHSIWELENGYKKWNDHYLQLYSDFFHASCDYLLGREKQSLIKSNIPIDKMNNILSSLEIKKDIELKAHILLNMAIRECEEDSEQIIALLVHLLKQKNIDYDTELKERYMKYLIEENKNE